MGYVTNSTSSEVRKSDAPGNKRGLHFCIRGKIKCELAVGDREPSLSIEQSGQELLKMPAFLIIQTVELVAHRAKFATSMVPCPTRKLRVLCSTPSPHPSPLIHPLLHLKAPPLPEPHFTLTTHPITAGQL